MKKVDFEKMTEIGELILTEFSWHDGSPMKVKIFVNDKTAFQVDFEHERYRSASLVKYKPMPYGDWQSFTK